MEIQNRQRGGSLRVGGWVSLLLLALCVTEAGAILHLYTHRTVLIVRPPAQHQNLIRTSAAG